MSPRHVNACKKLARSFCVVFVVVGWCSMLWVEAVSWDDFPLNTTNFNVVTTNTLPAYMSLMSSAIVERMNVIQGMDSNTNTRASFVRSEIAFTGTVQGDVVTNVAGGFTNIWTNTLLGYETNFFTNEFGTHITGDDVDNMLQEFAYVYWDQMVAGRDGGRRIHTWIDHTKLDSNGTFETYLLSNNLSSLRLEIEDILGILGIGESNSPAGMSLGVASQRITLVEMQYTSDSNWVASDRSGFGSELLGMKGWLARITNEYRYPIMRYHPTSSSTNTAAFPVTISWINESPSFTETVAQASSSDVRLSNYFSAFSFSGYDASSISAWNRPGDSWTLELELPTTSMMYLVVAAFDPPEIGPNFATVEWLNDLHSVLDFSRWVTTSSEAGAPDQNVVRFIEGAEEFESYASTIASAAVDQLTSTASNHRIGKRVHVERRGEFSWDIERWSTYTFNPSDMSHVNGAIPGGSISNRFRLGSATQNNWQFYGLTRTGSVRFPIFADNAADPSNSLLTDFGDSGWPSGREDGQQYLLSTTSTVQYVEPTFPVLGDTSLTLEAWISEPSNNIVTNLGYEYGPIRYVLQPEFTFQSTN